MEPFAWNVGKFHQKFELRKASGLDSWRAVPTPTFQLDLGPCHFTIGFGLKGVVLLILNKGIILPISLFIFKQHQQNRTKQKLVGNIGFVNLILIGTETGPEVVAI